MDSSADKSPKVDVTLTKALNGDVNAQFELAKNLETDQQTEVASGWYKKAALQGHADAALHTGMLCLKGDRAVQQDAAFWFQKAAALGCSGAEYQLALLYESGIGVRIDPDESLRWLRLAANHGNRDAGVKLEKLRSFLDFIVPDAGKRKNA